LPVSTLSVVDDVGGAEVHEDGAEDAVGLHVDERDRLRGGPAAEVVPLQQLRQRHLAGDDEHRVLLY